MGNQREVVIDGKGFSPQEISAMILQKLKMDAEAYLGEKITKAVVTVSRLLQRCAAAGNQGCRSDRRPRSDAYY